MMNKKTIYLLIPILFFIVGFLLCFLMVLFDIILSNSKLLGVTGAYLFSYGLLVFSFGYYLYRKKVLLKNLLDLTNSIIKKFKIIFIFIIILFFLGIFLLTDLNAIIFLVMSVIFLPSRLIILIFQSFNSIPDITVIFSILIGLPLTFYYWKVILYQIIPRINKFIESKNLKSRDLISKKENSFNFLKKFEHFKINKNLVALIFILGFLVRISFFFFGNVPGNDLTRYLYFINNWLEHQNFSMYSSMIEVVTVNGPFITCFFPIAALLRDSFLTVAIVGPLINSLLCYFIYKVISLMFKNNFLSFISYVLINFSFLFWIQTFDNLKESSSLFFLSLSLLLLLKGRKRKIQNRGKSYYLIIPGIILQLFALLYFYFVFIEFFIFS
ncbi:MAG: hypothetical protein P8Y70_18330 [Candidatus Lokiarchaeota archaeon]